MGPPPAPPPLSEDQSEIVFFDVETTIPTRKGQGYAILEFGAIVVCPTKLTELRSYSTLVRPADLSLITPKSEGCNGIKAEHVSSAPSFADIAPAVYELLHGRIWAGHNIIRFDCARIKEAFAEINQPLPEPKGTLDSLVLLSQKFGKRAGNMKMATLADYFGLGAQTHRSLDDVRMNLEVVKYCATVLFLESNVSDIPENWWLPLNTVTRSRSNGKSRSEGGLLNMNKASVLVSSPETNNKNHPILSLATSSAEVAVSNIVDSSIVRSDSSNFCDLQGESNRESIWTDSSIVRSDSSNFRDLQHICSLDSSSSSSVLQVCSSSIAVLEPEKINIFSIDASLVTSYRGTQSIELLHEGFPFQLHCFGLKVRFGTSTSFVDSAGWQKLNIVVDPSPSLCNVLDECDKVASKLSLKSGSRSTWRPVVMRKEGFSNHPTIRLHIPTSVCEKITICTTEIYQKESSGSVQRSKFDAAELNSLLKPGTFVDAFFSLDLYDCHHDAGIKLVAKKLIIQCQ